MHPRADSRARAEIHILKEPSSPSTGKLGEECDEPFRPLAQGGRKIKNKKGTSIQLDISCLQFSDANSIGQGGNGTSPHHVWRISRRHPSPAHCEVGTTRSGCHPVRQFQFWF